MPSKKVIDFWVKFFRGQEDNMMGQQNGSAVLIQSKEFTEVINMVLSVWTTVGEFKIFNGDTGPMWEWITALNRTVSVPKSVRKKLKRSAF